MKTLISIVVIACTLAAGILIGNSREHNKLTRGDLVQDVFGTPYSITILDDHEVQLISKYDTVSLYLENSGALAGEYIIFVKK